VEAGMRYSGHAEDRISEYGLTKAEVQAIVQNPMNVVTNAAVTVVITVVPE
jgi:hypothetical protein